MRQLLENYPQFMEPHGLKEEFRSIYRKKTRWEAEAAYAEWEAKTLKYAEFQALITSVRNWWNEIFAYFDHRYTNAATESLNRVINEIGRAGRGYSFDVLRVKVLFRSKASKPAKYRFPERNPFPARAGTFGFVFIPRQRKELVHGAGVDLQMLEESLKDGSFWESV